MLTFNLKKEWFEKIKSGEKTHEYREVKPYWIKRLSVLIDKDFTPYFIPSLQEACNDGFNHLYHVGLVNPKHKICFVCGYASKKDKEKILYAKVKMLSLYRTGKATDLETDKPVFDIEFELTNEVLDD